jgi:hypothetical protein
LIFIGTGWINYQPLLRFRQKFFTRITAGHASISGISSRAEAIPKRETRPLASTRDPAAQSTHPSIHQSINPFPPTPRLPDRAFTLISSVGETI